MQDNLLRKEIRLWTQGPMMRFFPRDPVPQKVKRTIRISAARGECECFQIGVNTQGFKANYITAHPTDIKGQGNAAILAANVDILYPEYVPVKWATGNQKPGDVERPAPGFYPDPLMRKKRGQNLTLILNEFLQSSS